MCDRDLEANGVVADEEPKGDQVDDLLDGQLDDQLDAQLDAYLRRTKIENDNAHLEPR